jgi:hypothetical protein
VSECRRGWTLIELLVVILFDRHLSPGERMPPGMDAD